jgi:hypothetical protein
MIKIKQAANKKMARDFALKKHRNNTIQKRF